MVGKTLSGAALGVAFLVSLMAGSAWARGAAALPATGGFINPLTALLIAGGVLLLLVGGVAFALLARRRGR